MQVHGVEFGNGGGEEPPAHQWSRRRRIRDAARHLSPSTAPVNQIGGGGVSQSPEVPRLRLQEARCPRVKRKEMVISVFARDTSDGDGRVWPWDVQQ
ncbi:hypothetical protein DEO72_LG9g3103 [Vigna unguiculata]|uniref:Uncharacterized protein n=1 Tax=Vigna unguiculata TaxID=3917 RepID=A0A4D6N6F8_VIGUN|nr:hypothetical protein DEO72_LG9g3103 [Vigna unguiculata]